MWKPGRDSYNSSPDYQKMNSSDDCYAKDGNCVRRGFVPMLVGRDGEEMEKLHVPVKLVKHPYIADLLSMSADEFGYGQEGLIRINFEPNCFKQMVKRISKDKR